MTNAHLLDSSYDSALAIIGMAGRFSGAQDLTSFWQNLAGGVKSIRFFSDEELLAAGVSPQVLAQPNFVKAGALLENVDRFDASFFGYTPREAELMDPQHRFFLECAWEAMEDAGYNTEQEHGLVGIFAGASFSSYLMRNLYHPGFIESVGLLQASIGSECDALTSTVSYKLNLNGPCVTVQTFCSTSLVAVHMAAQSLLNFECDMALAGGVAIEVPHIGGYMYSEGGIASPDGECRTFDASANGSVMGNGAGVVLLKRLSDALESGDHIYAVIRGSAVNNDGSHRVSITAPGLDGQSEVIAEALGNAGIEAESIGYIEAHGTATELGDEVELAAMLKAFETQTEKTQFCAIGSIKPNIGHLDRAAGVTGLIKTALALHNKQIPPSLNFTRTSQGINLKASPFYVNTALQDWPQTRYPRRAGVNSFGLGGTNAHAILEEAPQVQQSSPSRPWQLLLLSAKSETALLQARKNLASYLEGHGDVPLADIAYTLQVGRNVFPQRAALLCQSHAEARQVLADDASSEVQTTREVFRDRPVAFLFPGVGEQYAGLARELYRQEATFRATIDECCDFLEKLLQRDLRATLELGTGGQSTPTNQTKAGNQTSNLRALLGREGQKAGGLAAHLKNTEVAQPAIFIIEYALGKLLMHWGIQPQCMLGYSVGEYVAACLSGVLELEDALTLVAERAKLIQQQPAGAMLAVALSERELHPYLTKQVSLAVINAPRTCVVAGPYPAIAALETQLGERDIVCRRVETTHAFHSSMLEPVRAEVTTLASKINLHTPSIPYISNVTGTWITDEQATDPTYWAQHMCQTVRFADGVEQLLNKKDLLLLEVGPGQALCSFVRQHPACERERMSLAIATQPALYEAGTAYPFLLKTLGKLWLSGVTLDWQGFYEEEQRQRVSLPTYPFERQRYWVNPPTTSDQPTNATSDSQHVGAGPNDDLERLSDLKDWFYVPSWKQVPLPTDYLSSSLFDTPQSWLIFLDAHETGKHIARLLEERGQRVILVRPGQSFARLTPTTYTIRPDIRADYDTLLTALAQQSRLPTQVVHLWSLDAEADVNATLRHGLESLIALAQALGDQTSENCKITVVTSETQDILGNERINPAVATITGPCRVIPQEYVSLSCRNIDIAQSGNNAADLAKRLFAELGYTTDETFVALRGEKRWAQHFEPVALGTQSASSRLRQGGVYLITGGLGGIALAMAGHLARKYQATLVLTTRQPLPERALWADILANEGTQAGIGRKISQVQELEAQGASVLILKADVSNEVQMRTAIKETLATFGTLHGVLHAAGVPGSGLIQLKTAEQSAQILAPKLPGTLALERALDGLKLDFLALFSSMTSVTGGGPGQVDYCAANAFLDAYAHQPASHGLTVAIDWGEWQWNGWETALSGYNVEAQEYFRAHRQQFGISFEEGMEALERILSANLPQVVVSTQDFQIVAERSRQFTAAAVLQHTLESRQGRETHPRPTLASSFVAPRSETERKIAAIWEDLLGVSPIGIDDSFFELGGNSLSGIDLIARLKKVLNAPTLAAHVIYEAPTISSLARYIEQGQTTMPVEEWQDRSEKRLAGLRQRVREAGRSF